MNYYNKKLSAAQNFSNDDHVIEGDFEMDLKTYGETGLVLSLIHISEPTRPY